VSCVQAEVCAYPSGFEHSSHPANSGRRFIDQTAGEPDIVPAALACLITSSLESEGTNHANMSAMRIKHVMAQDGGMLDSEIREILYLSLRRRTPASPGASHSPDAGRPDAGRPDAGSASETHHPTSNQAERQVEQEAMADTRNLITVIGFWRRIRIGGGDTIMLDVRGADMEGAAQATTHLLQRYRTIFSVLVQAMRDGARRVEIEIGSDTQTPIATMSAHEAMHEKDHLLNYLVGRT